MTNLIMSVLLGCLVTSVAVADSVTLRLEGAAKVTKTAYFITDDGWQVWGFDLSGQPTWRLGHSFATIGNSKLTLLAVFAEKSDTWSAQVEASVFQQFGDVRLTGCVGTTLPLNEAKANLYSPGLSLSVPVGKRVRAGVASTFSWTSGTKPVWNVGPEVTARVSNRVSVGYRWTPVGTGANQFQGKVTLGW
jgi:hypothetical protein